MFMMASSPLSVGEFFYKKTQPQASDLSRILDGLTRAAKLVHEDVSRAELAGILGAIGTENVQGEEQQKLDVIANNRFIEAFTKSGLIALIGSEENEGIILTGNDGAEYVVAMDPLDGSSNIDVNVSIGTIFSIYKRRTPKNQTPTLSDLLQAGTEQVAGGYVLYGTSTLLVITTGEGVQAFTYDSKADEFLLSHPLIQTKAEGKIFSCNEGSYHDFEEGVKNYLNYCKTQQFKGRYIGSLVADFHRNLLKGGIFLYPATPKSPQGKLRLLYECNPLAFIAEQAGGLATDGKNRILDIQPTALHQRTPYYIGSPNMVRDVMDLLQKKS
jgi:fructose-1,6-bisphosphatase I